MPQVRGVRGAASSLPEVRAAEVVVRVERALDTALNSSNSMFATHSVVNFELGAWG